MRLHPRTPLALLGFSLLTACGGGGSSDGTTYDAAAGWQNLLSQSSTRTVAGRAADNRVYQFVLRITPLGNSAYPRSGAAAMRSDRRADLSIDGTLSETVLQSVYYTGAGNVIGSGNDDGSCSDVVTTLPPDEAESGDEGPLYTSTDYASCASNAVTTGNTTTARWSVDTAGGVAYFCINTVDREGSNVVGRDSECYQIAENGSIGSRAVVTLRDGSGTVLLVATTG